MFVVQPYFGNNGPIWVGLASRHILWKTNKLIIVMTIDDFPMVMEREHDVLEGNVVSMQDYYSTGDDLCYINHPPYHLQASFYSLAKYLLLAQGGWENDM